MRSHFRTRFHAFAKKLQVLNSHAFFEYLELFGVESSQVCLSMWLRVLSELITVSGRSELNTEFICKHGVASSQKNESVRSATYPLKCLRLCVYLICKAVLLSGWTIVSDDGVKPTAFFWPESLDFTAY